MCLAWCLTTYGVAKLAPVQGRRLDVVFACYPGWLLHPADRSKGTTETSPTALATWGYSPSIDVAVINIFKLPLSHVWFQRSTWTSHVADRAGRPFVASFTAVDAKVAIHIIQEVLSRQVYLHFWGPMNRGSCIRLVLRSSSSL